jgi:hypothetical protein
MPEECPQLTFFELIDPETLQRFVAAWRALELEAQKTGGSLVIRSAPQGSLASEVSSEGPG